MSRYLKLGLLLIVIAAAGAGLNEALAFSLSDLGNSTKSQAALANYDLMTALKSELTAKSLEAAEKLKDAASTLFWLLCGIAIVVQGVKLVFMDGTINGFFGIFVRFLIIVGLFKYLLDNGPAIGAAILDSLISVSGGGSGATQQIGPAELLDKAVAMSTELANIVNSKGSIFGDMMLSIILVLIDVLLFLIVVNYTILYFCAYAMCALGVIVVGFGALPLTRDFAFNYLKTIIALGLELMTMIIVCTSGMNVFSSLYTIVANDQRIGTIFIQDFLILLFCALFFYSLSRALPELVGSLVANGHFNLEQGRSGFRTAASLVVNPISTLSKTLYNKTIGR